jgi:hypothetical protein
VDGSGRGGSVLGLVAPFELGRAELAERGVPPARVVEALQVVEDRHPSLGLGAEPLAVQQLAFQGGKEAPGDGVVIAVADRALGGDQAGLAAATTP